jgi:hypothetical protein
MAEQKKHGKGTKPVQEGTVLDVVKPFDLSISVEKEEKAEKKPLKEAEVQWDALYLEYVENLLSVPQLADKYEVSVQRIIAVAQARDWRKKSIVSEVRDRTNEILVTDKLDNRTEAVEMAAHKASGIITQHRTRLSKLSEVADKTLDRLHEIVTSKDHKEYVDLATRYFPGENVVDVLAKLTNVIAKTISVERTAYNLDEDKGLKNLSDEDLLKAACGADIVQELLEKKGADITPKAVAR